ncbi:hypothetical protein E2562_021385 [Oryza meyeriana var. granulata]|uniref:Exocyst subunit Exo70 family protein n=1 Tax=Oryza meyeriana var. granulata TaxID=110450 RepID=A0A6G1EXJ2_9ORYZ|nr:hypothetical protein E2562_021385 [Oryza meyeriana var. granulata]
MRRLELELELLLLAVHDDAIDGGGIAVAGHDVQGAGVIHRICVVVEVMMAAGYGMECVSTFKSSRAEFAGIVHHLLGFSLSQHAHFHKLTWDDVDGKVQSWRTAAGFMFSVALSGERMLCHRVFAADKAVVDNVFASITSDHAADLLAVTEAAVARTLRVLERLLHVLDVHATLDEILPAIMCVLGDKSEVATRATAALRNAGEAARATLASFEKAIQKVTSKAIAPGGSVHPLTGYVMNYLVFLANYDDTLARVNQETHTAGSARALSDSPSSSNAIARLVSVLLRKLDAMTGRYRSPALRSLFMANNTHYVVKKVRGSGKLEGILGEDWMETRTAEARGHVDACVRVAWRDVLVGSGEGADSVARGAVGAQRTWVAADDKMGDVVRAATAAARQILAVRRCDAIVCVSPQRLPQT